MNKKGFSTVEILTVVGIIAILSVVMSLSLSAAHSKSRDAKRLSDIRQLQTALNLYLNEVGRYPIYITDDNFLLGTRATGTLATGLNQGFGSEPQGELLMPSVPADPKGNRGYYYKSDIDGLRYEIRFWFENDNESNGCLKDTTCFATPTGISPTDPAL
ncbi:MAG: type II secretion system GspH family protein [Candidatus Komeilibacteria bacterium]|nr:type II secretion system GspH family protein [Candidatus Komeilibacteria bacterium]